MKTLRVRLEDRLFDRLEEQANKLNVTMSDITREAIQLVVGKSYSAPKKIVVEHPPPKSVEPEVVLDEKILEHYAKKQNNDLAELIKMKELTSKQVAKVHEYKKQNNIYN